MILIDTAIKERIDQNKPIIAALIGAGYSGKNIAYQLINSFPGIKLAAISNRTIKNAEKVLNFCGINECRRIHSAKEVDDSIKDSNYLITDDYHYLCESDLVEVIIEATGSVEFGAEVALESIKNRKHVIVMNCEMDATVGPLLQHYAKKNDVIYSNTDGDEPGVASNLLRYVKTIGLKPVLAGNLKSYYDPYRTPDTQADFARQHNIDPFMATSFVDGTKLSMELAVLANSTGFSVGKRGMFGPNCPDVRDAKNYYSLHNYHENGIVDYLLGAEPRTGVFVIAFTDDRVKQDYLNYLKMGDGPYYVFYTPFHLPHLEIPITVSRAALFKDATVAPIGKPSCEVIAIAKKNMQMGEILDGIGGFSCYGLLENGDITNRNNFLPMGISYGCTLKNPVFKDSPITYDDVVLPENRFIDKLRKEQNKLFFE